MGSPSALIMPEVELAQALALRRLSTALVKLSGAPTI
jgi:hypothetical protein